ncbi:hypothetical protein [Streptomyces sp. NPDC008125]|uniref:hypothetical protein n=1 Tax=Streptomyces sp. NPDC008125 TaxID=3364811 RepID=UPI0036F106BE
MNRSTAPLQPLTRLVGGNICAYQPAADTWGALSPAKIFRPSAGDDVVEHTAPAGLHQVFYTTLHAAVCVTADGAEVWRSEFEPKSDERFGHRPGCALSSDGLTVWIYRPDAMAERGRPDQWVALDAVTGAVLAQADLDTVGHGGVQLVHRAGGEILLDVGEGQDGSVIYRASLSGGRMDLFRYPWDDRVLIDLSPDGRHFMTVDHAQGDMAVHTYPDGEVAFTLSVDALGHDPEEDYVEWGGGYLDPETIVVTVVGETESEEEWFRHTRVDARSGEVRGAFEAHGENSYDMQPLGDGSWLTKGPDGHPIRRRDS